MPESYDIRQHLLVARLPTLPQILVKMIEYCQTEEIGMAQLAELIAKDTAIASKILGTATSAAYHRRGGPKIQLEQAVMALGTDMIRTLVMSESMYQSFNRLSASIGSHLHVFWRHSLKAAVIARDIAKKMKHTNIDEAYLGGLLHDVGRLAFMTVAPGKYAALFHLPDDKKLCAAEQAALHLTHQEAGAWMIERWKLGSRLADCVLYHHETDARVASTPPLTRIVFVAHLLCCHDLDKETALRASALSGLDTDTLEAINNEADAKVREVADFLGIESAETVPEQPLPAETVAPQKQEPMGEELHNIVLASEAGRTFALQTDETSLFETVIRSARILFNLDDGIVLTLDREKQILVPVGDRQQRLSTLAIALTEGGPVAQAALHQRTVFIHRTQPLIGIPEAQLLRTLDADSLICMPLVSKGLCMGVLVGGASSLPMAHFEQKTRFMQVFASQATVALLSLKNKHEAARRQVENITEEFRLSSRKMAHEVNNPLAIIRNYLSLLNDKLTQHEPVGGEISILNQEIDRVSKILHTFAESRSNEQPKALDVNNVIHDVARLFLDTGFASETVKILPQTEGQPPNAVCDRDALTQILMNLIKNALEAMPDGGLVQIINNGHVQHTDQTYLKIAITDTGPGIPPEIMDNLFRPVSSSKGGQHRGLGLSIVRDLVGKSNGQINCRNSSKGASFEILLPVGDPARFAKTTSPIGISPENKGSP